MHLRRIINFFLHCHGIVASILMFLVIALNTNLVQSTSFFDKPKSFNASYQLSARFLKLISAGYWTAAVDYLWIQNLGRIGSGQYSNETLKLSRDDYRLALELDPDFYELYEQAGILFAFFHASPDDSIEFLSAGIRRYESGLAPPDFWTHPASLYIFLAYTYAFEKNDWPKAREVYLRAAEIKSSPLYLSKMKEWLQEKGSEKILAVRVLKTLIANTKDDLIRQKYEEKLKQYEH